MNNINLSLHKSPTKIRKIEKIIMFFWDWANINAVYWIDNVYLSLKNYFGILVLKK